MGKSRELVEIVISAVDKASKKFLGISGALRKIAKIGSGPAALGLAAVAAGGLGAAAGIAAVGGAMAKLAYDAIPLQGIQSAFDGIAKSAGTSGDAMRAALRKGASGMVTDRELMKSFNKASQLVGKTFAKQLPDAMGYLSKVSAATGEDMSYMIDSLVTGVGRLSPMILDNLGIQVSLSDATKRAAEMYGVEAGQLSKAQTQAGMMNVVLDKLRENTAAMPDIAGTAAQQWGELTATFGNLKDEIGMAVLPAFQNVAGALIPLIEQHLPEISAAISNIGIVVTQVTKSLMAGRIQDAFKLAFGAETGAQIYDVYQTLLNVGGAIGGIAGKLIEGDISGALTDTFGAETSGVIMTVAGALGQVGAWLGTNVPAALEKSSNYWNTKLLPAITDASNYVTGTLMPAWGALYDLFTTGVNIAVTAGAGIWQNVLAPALNKVGSYIGAILSPALSTLAAVFDATLGPVLDDIRPIIDGVAASFGDISGIVNGVTSHIRDLTRALKNIRLPDWMTPGSPTPWEIGLRGVSTAMNQLTYRDVPAFYQAVGTQPVVNNYNLTVNSDMPAAGVVQDFELLRSLAGA